MARGILVWCMDVGSSAYSCFNRFWVSATLLPGSCSCLRRWVLVIVCLQFLHLGEATNPGPVQSSDPLLWHLGTFNPSGLNGKQQIIAEHLSYGDIWAVSETHLSSRSMFAFKRGLQASKNPFKFVVAGHPTPLRPHSEHTGTWSGVAVLSQHPTRALPIDWPPDLFQSSRIQFVTTLCHDLWVTGAVVYGEPPGQLHPEAQLHTEVLLQHAVETLIHVPGCRYIAGDFNFEQSQLEVFHTLESHGFRDLQDLAMARWGQCQRVTCKGTTRKDYCYISRELQDLLVSVCLEDDVWSDHSVLVGQFRGAKHVIRHWWRVPQEFTWPEGYSRMTVDIDTNFSEGDPSQQYERLWHAIEQEAVNNLQGGNIIRPSQLGRAKTRQTIPRKGPIVPVCVKPSRSGEIQPLFHGQSRQHAQWFRQLRRLQAFVRFSKAHPHDTEHAHGAALWRSVLTARGFVPDFVTWWKDSCLTHLDGTPEECPLGPPSHATASAMYVSFTKEVRTLEQKLLHSRCQFAKERRREQANLIFRDIQKTPPDRLELLLGIQEAKIESVDPDTFMLTLSKPINLDVTKSCFVAGRERQLVQAEQTEVFVVDAEGITVGDKIVQTAHTGHVDDLLVLFQKEWSKRWDRHRHVPPSQWQQIIDFNARHLPKVECSYTPLSQQQLCSEIFRKKLKSATGPDGVSLQDLRSMPVAALQAHTAMLCRAEMDGSWPEQTLVGRVASLGKVDHPSKVSDFRPITVLSHIYRIWSGLRARDILGWLDEVCPAFLLGNRPSCMAAHSWSHIQWLVEMTFWQQTSLAGLTADIQKAFNHLPREVLMHACVVLNIPQPIIRAWSGALGSLCRRFQVRDSWGPAIYSSTGCPEGCAMSCIGMLLVDLMLHKWLTVQFPLCQPMSYVDDWQFVTKDPSELEGIHNSLVDFTEAVDLLLDRKKTFAWTLDSATRKSLRQKGLSVRKSAKALGAQMQFSRQHVAFVIHDRLKDLQPLWSRLRNSLSPYRLKVRAIKVAAWPRGLHGISAVCLGATRFVPLRSAAMKGLSAEGSGCNPMVHLGLVEEPLVDPQYWSVIATFRALRDCGTRESLQPLLQSVVLDDGRIPRGGPTRALLQRIQLLGWTVGAEGNVSDNWGSFSLFEISMQELEIRAEAAWAKVVAASVQYRPCFTGLVEVDAPSTRAFLATLSCSEQALFRKALNGASFTNDSQCYYSDSGSTICEYCGQDDSRFHRFWRCPVFEPYRQKVPLDVRERIEHLPACLTQAGWSLKPATLDAWWATLLDIAPPVVEATGFVPSRACYDLFTDGSCMFPKAKHYRIASWAVCLAGLGTNWDDSMVLQAGQLPGLMQSAFRAELYAVYVAVWWSRVHRKRVRIWSDCLGVVRRFKKLLKSGRQPKHGVAHYDLWVRIYEELQQLPPGDVEITKVAAHQQKELAESEFELWVVVNNLLADRAARLANLCRSPEFWKFYHHHVDEVTRTAEVGLMIQQVILDISKQVVQRERCHTADGSLTREAEGHDPPTVIAVTGTWQDFQIVSPLPWKLTQIFGFTVTSRVAAWLKQAMQSAEDGGVPCRWIAFHQMYLDFQMATGDVGPIYDKGWIDTSRRPDIRLQPFPFRKRSSWFVRLLKRLVKASGGTLDVRVLRPHSTVFALHTASVWIAWPQQRLDWVEEWTCVRVSRSITRDGKLMDSLPVPTRDRRWPQFFLEDRPLCL